MKKVLVTGGAGYIGSHTCVELSAAGYLPVIADNLSNSRASAVEGIAELCTQTPVFRQLDFTDYDAVERLFVADGPFHGVIHFAAFKAVGDSVKHPLKYYRNNLQSTEVLLSAMARHGCSLLVFSSSCTVYGQPDVLPVNEDAPIAKAHSPYGLTKQVCEQMIRDTAYAPESALSAVLLRYFNPIGAHPSGLIGELPLGAPENLVPYITQSAAGIRGPLTIFGSDYNTPDGTCVRDYIHVCDLAAAHVSALAWLEKSPKACEPINLGTGTGNSVKEVIDTFQSVTGVPLHYTFGARRSGDVEQIYARADKAWDLLGWRTERTLRDALIDAWNWQLQLEKKPHA
jgi:UDP-glucose 4-epimerase